MRVYIIFTCCMLVLLSGCTNHTPERNKGNRVQFIEAIGSFKNAIDTRDSTKIAAYIDPDVCECEESYMIGEFATLFATLDINALSGQDTLSKKLFLKNEPCCTRYSIYFKGDSVVTFEFYMDTNTDYKMTPEEIAGEMDQSILCEHITWWDFSIVNGRLKLVKTDGAD